MAFVPAKPTVGETSPAGANRKLVLVAMIFAVGMTFIDMTIVSIAIPEIQRELHLSQSGLQWIVNAYMLSLAAFFAFGGRLADIVGHRRLVVIGVVVFAGASAANGAVPTGALAELWFIAFRAVQGFGAALMLPAALAIVVGTFELRARGRALAVFFAITGGLTAVGPIAGGYLSEWTWRAIFWVNIPVAIVALVLIHRAHIQDTPRPARIDWRGLVLIASGMGLSVLGLEESSHWGWNSAATWGCIGVGTALLVVFVVVELRTASPLIQMKIFANRAFAVENAVLFFAMMAFIPVFFFASVYAQVGLGDSSSEAGMYILTFFLGFAPAAQVGGRVLDRHGAKPAVVAGGVIAAIGFFQWANRIPDLSFNDQFWWIVCAGAGLGLLVGPANTDAINRAARVAYGEVSGVTQTIRNYGSSIGLALLGTVFVNQTRTHLGTTLQSVGLPQAKADAIAQHLSQSGGGTPGPEMARDAGRKAAEVFAAAQHDLALAMKSVFLWMAIAMVVAALVALLGLRFGRQEHLVDDPSVESVATP